jgi:hypothetical protein
MNWLQAPASDQMLAPLFDRSVLFLLACLPVIVAWQQSRRSLFLQLAFALFATVGVYILNACRLPLALRLPHTLEILCDEYVYAAAVALLLPKGSAAAEQAHRLAGRGAPA